MLHAAGDHFTGGIDLPAMAEFHQRGEKPVPRGEGWVDPLDLGLEGYRQRSKPVVVAVQGICFTIGIELMLAADMVVAADNCRFAQMEVGRGGSSSPAQWCLPNPSPRKRRKQSSRRGST